MPKTPGHSRSPLVRGRVQQGIPWVSAMVSPLTAVPTSRGAELEVWFMIDSGAETSMLGHSDTRRFALHGASAESQGLLTDNPENRHVLGIGGAVYCRTLEATLVFRADDGRRLPFRGSLLVAGAGTPGVPEFSVMGRDLLRNFAEFSFPCSADAGEVRLLLHESSTRGIARDRA